MIFQIGYAQKGAMRQIDRLVTRKKTYLLDIRYKAWSGQEQWRKEQLQERYQKKYIHIPELGNINYKQREKGIELVNPDKVIQNLRLLLQRGYSFILLCGCLDYNKCHRKVVYELLTQREINDCEIKKK